MKLPSNFFSQNKVGVESIKQQQATAHLAPLPRFDTFAGNAFEYKKALEQRFESDTAGMYRHVAGQDSEAQKAILEKSDRMREFLAISDRRASRSEKDTINYTEAPIAWAKAAPLLSSAKDQQRAMDNLIGLHNDVRTRSQESEYKKTVEDACVHLLQNLGALKNATVQQKALTYIASSRQELDGKAQGNIAQAAQKTLDNPNTRYELRDSLGGLVQPLPTTGYKGHRLHNRLSQQMTQPQLPQHSPMANQHQTAPQLPPRPQTRYEKDLPPAPPQFQQQAPQMPPYPSPSNDPRAFTRHFQKATGSVRNAFVQIPSLGGDAFRAALRFSGEMRDHVGVSFRATKRNDRANSASVRDLAQAAVALNKPKQIHQALKNMRHKMEHQSAEGWQRPDVKESAAQAFTVLLRDFGHLKNDTLKQEAVVLVSQFSRNLDDADLASVRVAAESAMQDPTTSTELKRMLEPIARSIDERSVRNSTINPTVNHRFRTQQAAVNPMRQTPAPWQQQQQSNPTQYPPMPQPGLLQQQPYGTNPYNPMPQPQGWQSNQQGTNSAPVFENQHWATQTHQTNSAPVYSSFQLPPSRAPQAQQYVQNQFSQMPAAANPVGTTVPTHLAQQLYAKSISDMKARGVNDQELGAVRAALTDTVNVINHSGDASSVQGQVAWFNAHFSKYCGEVSDKMVADMDGMVWAINRDLNARGLQ